MNICWLSDLRAADVAIAGGKGANLGELVAAGLPVPAGFVITTAAYERFAETGRLGELADEILRAYRQLGDDAAVAVRSSATAEDLAEASFAGQQETYLNVRGPDAVLSAVQDCWASLWGERAVAYRASHGVADADVRMAVVVQRMVQADAAGVMFTANPTNGRRDELVISAAWGLGEAVVSGQVDTDVLVLSGDPPAVQRRTTADKAVMTCITEHGTAELPVPPELRAAPVLDDETAIRLADLGRRAAAHFGAPQDLEWALAAGPLVLLQSRAITALAEPEGPVPTEWPVPEPHAWYFRASIVEQLPDPLTPLFADLIDPSVTRSLRLLMNELISEGVVREGDVALPTINGYAYYQYGWRGGLRITLRTPLVLPVLSRRSHRSGLTRWRDYSHPRYVAAVQAWQGRPLAELSGYDLLTGVVALLDAGTEYYTSVQTIIPVAALSEVIFSRYYETFVRRRTDPAAQLLLLGGDSSPIRADKSLWDLAQAAIADHALGGWLRDHRAPEITTRLAEGSPPTGVDATAWTQWRQQLQRHLDAYGHAVYNLDFVNPVPAEEPAPLIDTVRFYLGGQGTNPYERQRHALARREEAAEAVRARLDPLRRRVFERLLRWAQAVGPAREDALADVGLAWPLLRRMLRELGSRLVAAGTLSKVEDVFWLRKAEIDALLSSPDAIAGLPERLEERRATWRGQRRATPPQMLPQRGGIRMFERFLPAAAAADNATVIKGLGASAGEVTAPARVLRGPADFDQLAPGEILVTTITTPAWTPLFARAGGVVTDIGGPLSHSSIVAREYGIPAVLGTGVATRRIRSGQRIHVDGNAGSVALLDAGHDEK